MRVVHHFLIQLGRTAIDMPSAVKFPLMWHPLKRDPEATLAKLDVVIAAALAPAKPSAQDRKIAAAAVAARNQARAELTEKRAAEQSEDKPSFDINDFGDTPPVSVNKAYEIGNDLGQKGLEAGITISVTS